MPLSTTPSLDTQSPLPSGDSVSRKARFWDRIARKYAADPIADMPGYEATLRRVQGLLTREMNVLEIGCGTGSTALRLAPFTRRLLATDVSAGMIAIAREKLAAEPIPQLAFALADADAPAIGPGDYDAVLAFNLLHLVSDLDGALALAVQALKPGGRLISKTACVAEMNPLIRWLAIPVMQAIGKAPHVLLFDADTLQAAMVRQGLVIEAVERHGTKGKDIRVFIVARKPG
ncbi:class I SAM-dependent methyltransferase [Hydrogenophaga pseudoflava]|uniref:class I SAM-dependent methyltransferase n=1 Tax=Hydrogenophaga pseudoflava TaxID=47421 RepID=UPI0027E3D01B|nr:methyltransferase domain-containing protein [Hydrogenophaga pseudoflava]MDQ7745744.1 methyltransferase domain-containing protein [Hydrogenophaga pseudoflava]